MAVVRVHAGPSLWYQEEEVLKELTKEASGGEVTSLEEREEGSMEWARGEAEGQKEGREAGEDGFSIHPAHAIL